MSNSKRSIKVVLEDEERVLRMIETLQDAVINLNEALDRAERVFGTVEAMGTK